MSPEARMSVVRLEAAHWERVRAIYLEGLATRQASFETTAPDWDAWDASHLEDPRLVAVEAGEVLGWAALSPVSRRAVYRGVAEVSVYVAAHARGRGIGRLLLEAMVKESEALGFWTLQASIFPENTPSIRLHESCGFRMVGRRRRIAQHYGAWRDTVILERRSDVVGTDG